MLDMLMEHTKGITMFRELLSAFVLQPVTKYLEISLKNRVK